MKDNMKYDNKEKNEGKANLEKNDCAQKRLKEMASVAKRAKKLPGTV